MATATDGAAEESSAASEKTAKVYVHCVREQRCRAGHVFGRGWNSADVTKKQLEAIDDDPHLVLHTKKPKALEALEVRQAADTKAAMARREAYDKTMAEKRKAAREVRDAKIARMHEEAKAEEKAAKKRAK